MVPENGSESEGKCESDPIGKGVRGIKKLRERLDGIRMISDHIKAGLKTTDRKGRFPQ